MSRTIETTPTGLSKAITAIAGSRSPLKVWLRTRLVGTAVNEVLAIPAHHRRPTGASVLVGVFGRDETRKVRDAVLETRKRVSRNT